MYIGGGAHGDRVAAVAAAAARPARLTGITVRSEMSQHRGGANREGGAYLISIDEVRRTGTSLCGEAEGACRTMFRLVSRHGCNLITLISNRASQ